jgi:hypothetical protein
MPQIMVIEWEKPLPDNKAADSNNEIGLIDF